MVGRMFCSALALVLAAVPAIALADDPHDPQMRTQAARERDRAIIRKLNEQELRIAHLESQRRNNAVMVTLRLDERAPY